MIRDHLRQPLVDPLSQHEKLEENIRRLQKKAKRGRFSRKKNLDSSEESDTEENAGPIDPALTQRIFDAYLESANRREMLHSLHSGEIHQDALSHNLKEDSLDLPRTSHEPLLQLIEP